VETESLFLPCCRFKREGHLSVKRTGKMVRLFSLYTSVHKEYLGNPG
jgi:hypothetical protein